MYVSLIFFSIGIILFPFYMFPSGIPQPGHIFFLTSSFLSIFFSKRKFILFESYYVKVVFIFVLYVVLINTVNSFYFSFFINETKNSRIFSLFTSAEPLTYSLFYIFNFIIFFGFLCMGDFFVKSNKLEYFLKIILCSIITCLIIQFFIGFLGVGRHFKESFRGILFFNNPNQLGYFSVAMASLLFIINIFEPKYKVVIFLTFSIVLYIASLALSKAAIISICFFPFIYIIQSKGNSIYSIVFIMSFIVFIIWVSSFIDSDILSNLERRMLSIGKQSDDGLEGRAYDRLIKFPHYLVFGAGEGLRLQRFGSPAEIHSLFATLLFSYGFIGFIIFYTFVYKVYDLVRIRCFIVLIPLGLYNLTHNGFRSPLLWVIFSFLIIYSYHIKNSGSSDQV